MTIPPYKLPLVATIAESYRFLAVRFTSWFQLAIIPLVIWIAIFLVTSNNWFFGWNRGLGSDSPLVAFLLLNAPISGAYLLVTVSLLLYAVALHRLVLALPGSAGVFAWFSWRARHIHYIGQAVVVVAIILVGIVVSGTFIPMVGAIATDAGALDSTAGQITLTVIVLLLFAAPIALLACMVLLALPAAAAEDHAITLSEASNQAKGNLWRMTFIFLIGGLIPFWLIERGIAFLTARSTTDIDPKFFTEISSIIVNFLAFTVLITLLSLVYRRLRNNKTLKADLPPR
ncbi:MAG: hypothetical protein CL573_06340 [Alphaproteobacteria bacterium]|nr:hypothetical protein [Alphaproteobacteria bacterium]HCP01337.1 hypothetical protein [Rhodospirillaceae bacterium]